MMNFQYVKTISGEVDPDNILYSDETGIVWLVPQDHRFWQIYQNWLAQGNTPQVAA